MSFKVIHYGLGAIGTEVVKSLTTSFLSIFPKACILMPVTCPFLICTKLVCTSLTDRTGLISVELQMYVGAESSHDAIHIEGVPSLESRIEGGVHGDAATVAKVINSIPRVLNEKPGLLRPINMNLNLV